MGPRVKKRPIYRIPTLAEMESGSSPRAPGPRRRGRPPGSKMIDGKLYRAGEYPSSTYQTQIPAVKRSMLSTAQESTSETDQDIEEQTEEDEEEGDEDTLTMEIPETQPLHKRSSQMAGAALAATDSEDMEDDAIDEEDDEDNEGPTSAALLRAYGADEQTDEENDPDVDIDIDSDNPTYLSAWRQNAVNSNVDNNSNIRLTQARSSQDQTSPPKAQPPSKSQIFESVEQGADSTLAKIAVADPGYGSDEDEDEEDFDLNEWKSPRNMRGGTEESIGGDYKDEDDEEW